MNYDEPPPGNCIPPTITQAYPPLDLDELVSGINRFPYMSLDGKRIFIDRLVNIHPALNLEWGPGHHFRRARKLDIGALPEAVADVIWPNDGSAELGRGNPEGVRRLYLADRQDTALCEARVKNGWVVIARFDIRPGHSAFIYPIGEINQIARTGRGFLTGGASDEVSRRINACPLREQRSLVLTDAFIYEQMVGHDEYEISSHIATAIFNKRPNLSAIAYSSRRHEGALNLVVRTETFWENWGLLSVKRAYARHLALGFYELGQITHVEGIYNSGKFRWEEHADSDEAHLFLDPPFFPPEFDPAAVPVTSPSGEV